MNTTGWVRGYISNNSPNDKFVSFVINTIGKEFRLNTAIQLINDTYVIKVGQYETRISINEAKSLQITGPYVFDKRVLDSLKEQGLSFLPNRSQYVRYCYGLIDIASDIEKDI